MDPSFLLAFPLLLALSTLCSACNCKIQHPQTYYCTSDVVILADILGPANNTRTKRGFRVNVIKMLKAPQGTPRIHEIYSPISWTDCGYRVRNSHQSLLLIAGYLRRGTLRFTRCHLVYFWYRLTRQQKLGFEVAYRTGCKCEVSSYLSDFSLQPRHCSCPMSLFPDLSPLLSPFLDDPCSFTVLPFPGPGLFPLSLAVLAPFTVPFSFLLYPCCPLLSRMGGIDKRWAALYLPPSLDSALPHLLA
ncbi:metalloproteinase inhibitor 1-like isoform X1 [Zalophus californianus]|uniref:Metalloproteinase inhibitor 1-like isoform X1 n=1 Tax=Zalophus californianus TaxID=9704 RepID=A0A6J2F2V5_ZALCA|nr:metalloproteinase inhibitor 1-like isoform X1 [Zalophus californianus]XP_027475686.1 metalloproteinase inhibitor 1-like isoform X1 [Zalophus californianus]